MFVQSLRPEECHQVLANAGFGRLACARENRPYVVPIYFIVEDGHVYSFSLPGQKLEWMRSNPRVCLEVDSVRGADDWVTVVASGCFEELPDTLESRPSRQRAHQLLSQRPMWWEPGAITMVERHHSQGSEPVYYRINIEQVTGHRAAISPNPAPLTWATRPEPT